MEEESAPRAVTIEYESTIFCSAHIAKETGSSRSTYRNLSLLPAFFIVVPRQQKTWLTGSRDWSFSFSVKSKTISFITYELLFLEKHKRKR